MKTIYICSKCNKEIQGNNAVLAKNLSYLEYPDMVETIKGNTKDYLHKKCYTKN